MAYCQSSVESPNPLVMYWNIKNTSHLKVFFSAKLDVSDNVVNAETELPSVFNNHASFIGHSFSIWLRTQKPYGENIASRIGFKAASSSSPLVRTSSNSSAWT
mmetsp:Transcript_19569/g.41003  ORF Transcript_19569/g.41003 Transcript_19569/m.41003 type:complete len:103 (+) Transcript_19569:1415-1723(+)